MSSDDDIGNVGTEYSAVPLAKIKPDTPLPADVFVKISEKHIRFKYEKDIIDHEKYDLFLTKKISSLYVEKSRTKSFMSWITEVKQKDIETIVKRVGVENREIVEEQQKVKEVLFQSFSEAEISEESVSAVTEVATKLVSTLKQKKSNANFLAYLVNFDPALADHSLNVANLSVYLALHLEQQHPAILEKIFLGGLYHDYGKVLIAPKIFENKHSAAYVNAMNVHSVMGCDALKKAKGVLPEQVLLIVAQHHEQFNGGGVPNKLSGDQIYGLTKIVSIANIFENIVAEDHLKKGCKDIYKRAFTILELDRGKLFDPAFLGPAREALTKVYEMGTALIK